MSSSQVEDQFEVADQFAKWEKDMFLLAQTWSSERTKLSFKNLICRAGTIFLIDTKPTLEPFSSFAFRLGTASLQLRKQLAETDASSAKIRSIKTAAAAKMKD
ncbi:hypothetical protein MMC10_010580 [Thelotrema lepadinum]|nr:hypothetical protein [Thelotrema lepadinum]